jgi:hypothetical protein
LGISGVRRLLQRRHGQAAARQDDVRFKRDQFGRIFAQQLEIARCPAKVDPHIAAFVPAPRLQRFSEHRYPIPFLDILGGNRHDHADAPHSAGLLRARGACAFMCMRQKVRTRSAHNERATRRTPSTNRPTYRRYIEEVAVDAVGLDWTMDVEDSAEARRLVERLEGRACPTSENGGDARHGRACRCQRLHAASRRTPLLWNNNTEATASVRWQRCPVVSTNQGLAMGRMAACGEIAAARKPTHIPRHRNTRTIGRYSCSF